MKHAPSSAFSLLEVSITIILVTLAMVTILHLWKTVLRIAESRERHESELYLAKSIAEILQASSPESKIAIGPQWKNLAVDSITLDLKIPNEYYLAYTKMGEPAGLLEQREYQQGGREASLRKVPIKSIVKISTSPSPVLGLSQIFIDVSSPAKKPEKERDHVTLSLLLPSEF